jgi:hypothetical protein
MIIQAPPNRGYLRAKYKRRGLGSVCAIVIHTTGGGIIQRWQRQGEKFGEADPFETALRVYNKLMDAGPHFVIGQAGQVAQTCPLDFAAWHVGKLDSRPYWSKNTVPGHKWWHDRWGHSFKSPAEMADGLLWAGGECNPNVVGIEVVPEIDDPRGVKFPWRKEAYDAIQGLCLKIQEICPNLQLRPDTVLGHADAHPLSRTSLGKPWDPTPLQWSPENAKTLFLQ